MEKYTVQERVQIIQVYYETSRSLTLTIRELRNHFPRNHVPAKSTVQSLVARFVETGSVGDLEKSSRPRTARSSENVATVAKSVRETPGTSIRHRSQELNISRTSLQRILTKDLQLHAISTEAKNEKQSEVSKSRETSSKKSKRAGNESEEPAPKRAKTEPKQIINKIDTNWDEIDFECQKLNADGNKYNLKISSWNVSGIRAVVKKNGIKYIMKEDADIVVLQETKCDKDKIPEEVKLNGYHHYFLDSKKPGYCGVALYSKEKPIDIKYGLNNSEFDNEGRLIMAEYPKFYLIGVYVPNAGQKLVTLPKRLQWNEVFKTYIKKLDEKKPVIICGDMNVAHQEIDLTNPKTNTKNAGFTKEEREGMTDFLATGFVDTFRALYPERTGAYTFWSYFANARNKNIGWRLDYFLVSQRIKDKVCDNVIRNEVYGSDHCPTVLYINM
ncbi:recombination repair protein 1 isoform X2 [Ptiloglossa arizonensis]|uniref:recombination repair protein 1 isoform X2 n=1 Tax=Ptiloglossa arizonensis TaxID=3350558 RepID=UPI003FA03DE8